ncbi:MAG: hypothetical protein ACREAA_00020 [Candidatus Polarisedimenticolia bacterium]
MSRKQKREGRLIHGDELLESRGIDLDADDEALLPALLAAIGTDPDADLSIADWLGSIPSEEAAARLAAWDRSQPADKDLRRLIRASLFRLEQRGVAAAAAARERADAEAARPIHMMERAEPTGYLSALDGAGNRLAWLTRARPEGGLIVMSSIINDRAGMRQVVERTMNKGAFKETLADLDKRHATLAQAPPRYVDWLMQDAYRRGVPRDEQGGGYPLMRADFYPEPAAPVPSPLDEMAAPMPAEEQAALLEKSGDLFGLPEFGGWMLPDDLVKVHQQRFHDAQDSSLVLSKQQMTERLTGIVDQAFEEVVETEARALYALRLADMALWFHLAHREEPARLCLALQLALNEPSRRLKEVPFLRGLALRSFLHLMPREAPEPASEGEADASTLIVRP